MTRLYLAALAHSFGARNNARPVRSALLRLGGLGGAAALLGFLIGTSMDGLTLTYVPHAYLLTFSAAVAVQIAAGFALVVALGVMRAGQSETFVKLLLTWPITKRMRWALFMLPNLILAALAVILIGWPLSLLLAKLGLSWPLLLLGAGFGYCSAFGLVRGLPLKLRNLLVVWIGAVVWLEYQLLQRINDTTLPVDERWWYAAGLMAILLLLTGLFATNNSELRALITAKEHAKKVRFSAPPRAWFLTKLLRRPNIRLSFGVALLMSGGIAIASQRYGLTDPEALGLFAAILAASFATDLRALSRRHNPAEITALRATRRFSGTYLAHTAIGSLLAVGPILWALTAIADGWHLAFTAHIILQLLIGIAAGAFAGTFIVPEGRDISSQFMSTIIVLGILFALPQLPIVESLSLAQRTIVDMGCCLLLVLGVYAIEYKRNPYTWRKRHAA